MSEIEDKNLLYDRDIREPLFEFLENRFDKVRILEEKPIGKSRADVLMVTKEALWGLEIKSDADTYTRLESQVKDYGKYCDYCVVVVGSTHAKHVEDHVPSWWGIITVDPAEISSDLVSDKKEADFYVLRKAQKNPEDILKRKLSLLWRIELVHIQEKNEMPKYKEKSKLFVNEKILQKVDPDLLHRQISEELFERDYTTIKEVINEYRKAKGRRKKRRPPKRLKI